MNFDTQSAQNKSNPSRGQMKLACDEIDFLRSRLKEVEGEFADMKAACESGKCSDLIEAREREANLENIIVICASNGCPLCSLPATQEAAPKAQEKKI